MSNLQSGVTASDLSPQNFKNSSQEGVVQSTDNLSNSQSNVGSIPSINNLPADTKLKVVDGAQNQSILGLSTTPQTVAQQPEVIAQSSSSIAPFVIIILISASISVYLFRKYFEFATVEVSTE